MESEELQDELSAIELIYPGYLKKLAPLIYEIKVPQHEAVVIQMSFPASYPEEQPEIIQVVTDKTNSQYYDDKYLQTLFQEVLDSIFTEDMVCIFDFLTELDAVMYVGEEEEQEEQAVDPFADEPEGDLGEELEQKLEELSFDHYKEKNSQKQQQLQKQKTKVDPLEGWVASEPITDRKSTFQAFVKEVHSVDEAMELLELLKQDRKIMRSSHNMTAYRIKDGEIKYSDFDDDGESAAGARMLHLLTIMDLWNCIAVVSRWFGGLHIGPDRFKHINSTTREAILKSGLVSEDKANGGKGKKKKNH